MQDFRKYFDFALKKKQTEKLATTNFYLDPSFIILWFNKQIAFI